MNILLCTSEVGKNAGGLAFHCNQLKEVFETLGHHVDVEILLDPKEYYALDGGYDIALGKKIRISKKIMTLNRKYGKSIDLCVSCGAGKTAYYSMLFCKTNNIPLNIVLCGSEVNIAWGSAEIIYYSSEAFKYASAIIGLSEELISNAKILNENLSCKYYVIPIFRNMREKSVNKYEASKEKIEFITGSSYLGEKKGIANLLYAFSKLKDNFKRNDVLYLVGEIDEDVRNKYMEIIETCNLSSNVYLLGYLPREDFINRVQNADVYIQASPFEGFGMSVVEALDAGIDILITNTGYIAETIFRQFPGHIMVNDTPIDIASEINDYICNVYPKCEKNSIRTFVGNKINSQVVIDKWKEIINNTTRINRVNSKETCLSVMFHDVDTMYSGVDYAVEGFSRLMHEIFMKGYRLCSAKEYFRAEDKSNLIICTFDDGYENVYRNAFPIMKEYGFTATVFVCPDLIGKNNTWNHRDEVNRKHMSDEMICALVKYGWEIGSHGLSHMNMIRLSEHELDKCLGGSKEMLSKYGEIDTYCYPYGIFNTYIKNKTRLYYSRAFSVDIGGSDYATDLYQITRFTPEALIRKLDLM